MRAMRSRGLFSVSFVVVALFVLTSCKRDGKGMTCTSFSGGPMSAVWTGCPDKVRREVTCAPFIDDLKCDCFEDGARHKWFHAKDPPLSEREDATRVANANCRWALEMP